MAKTRRRGFSGVSNNRVSHVEKIKKEMEDTRLLMRHEVTSRQAQDSRLDEQARQGIIQAKLLRMESEARSVACDLPEPQLLGFKTIIEKGFNELTVDEVGAIEKNYPIYYSTYRPVFMKYLESWVRYREIEQRLQTYLENHKFFIYSYQKRDIYLTVLREFTEVKQASIHANFNQYHLLTEMLTITLKELKNIAPDMKQKKHYELENIDYKLHGLWNPRQQMHFNSSIYLTLVGLMIVAGMALMGSNAVLPLEGFWMALTIIVGCIAIVFTGMCLFYTASRAKEVNKICELSYYPPAAKMTAAMLSGINKLHTVNKTIKFKNNSKLLKNDVRDWMNKEAINLVSKELPFRESSRHPR